MKNYKYDVGDEEFILSEAEDAEVRQLQEKGEKGIVFLRKGDIRLNLSFVRSAQPTEKLTYLEEIRILANLPPPSYGYESNNRSGSREFLQITHDDFYTRMKWAHPKDCACKIENTKIRSK